MTEQNSRSKRYNLHEVERLKNIAHINGGRFFLDKPAVDPLDDWLLSLQKRRVLRQIYVRPHTPLLQSAPSPKQKHTPHVVNCTNMNTNLTTLDLWTTPVDVRKLFVVWRKQSLAKNGCRTALTSVRGVGVLQR